MQQWNENVSSILLPLCSKHSVHPLDCRDDIRASQFIGHCMLQLCCRVSVLPAGPGRGRWPSSAGEPTTSRMPLERPLPAMVMLSLRFGFPTGSRSTTCSSPRPLLGPPAPCDESTAPMDTKAKHGRRGGRDTGTEDGEGGIGTVTTRVSRERSRKFVRSKYVVDRLSESEIETRWRGTR